MPSGKEASQSRLATPIARRVAAQSQDLLGPRCIARVVVRVRAEPVERRTTAQSLHVFQQGKRRLKPARIQGGNASRSLRLDLAGQVHGRVHVDRGLHLGLDQVEQAEMVERRRAVEVRLVESSAREWTQSSRFSRNTG